MAGDRFPATKARRRIKNRLLSQLNAPGPRAPGASRFIESNMAITANSQQLPVNFASFRNLCFVFQRSHFRIIETRGGHVNPLWIDVHMIKKVAPHLKPIAALVISAQSFVFIQIETCHIRKRQAFLPMTANEFAIKIQRRASSCQSQNHGLTPPGSLPNQSLHFVGNRQTHLTPITRMGDPGTNLYVFEHRHF